MWDYAGVGLDQFVRDSSGTPTQALAAGLCRNGTDLCGTGREKDHYLVLRRALNCEVTQARYITSGHSESPKMKTSNPETASQGLGY